ncbi:MAG: hypothetical protein WA323_13565 [Candidatus Nitrosopolaris sp.]|jgi:hypothetical protein
MDFEILVDRAFDIVIGFLLGIVRSWNVPHYEPLAGVDAVVAGLVIRVYRRKQRQQHQ